MDISWIWPCLLYLWSEEFGKILCLIPFGPPPFPMLNEINMNLKEIIHHWGAPSYHVGIVKLIAAMSHICEHSHV